MRFRLVATAFSFAFAASAQAQNTVAGTPGSLPANSFGGSGIPTNQVMLGGVDGSVMGLSATQRYQSPAVTWNGAGTYYAGTGESVGAPVNTGFSAWNFDYYATQGANSQYVSFFDVLVDIDPTINTNFIPWATNGTGLVFDSSNEGYLNLFFGPGFFNPNTPGEYTIRLEQHNAPDGAPESLVDAVSINVDVSSTPEPASLVLIGTGLAGVGVIARRRRSA